MIADVVSSAWLLELSGGARVAVGEQELLYVIPEEPVLHEVPYAPPHARHIVVWQDRILPLADPGQLLPPADDAAVAAFGSVRSLEHLLAIVAFDDQRSATPGVGALLLRAVPSRIFVRDDWVCAIPAATYPVGHLLKTCFVHPDWGTTPILDLAALFGGSPVNAVPQFPRDARTAPGTAP